MKGNNVKENNSKDSNVKDKNVKDSNVVNRLVIVNVNREKMQSFTNLMNTACSNPYHILKANDNVLKSKLRRKSNPGTPASRAGVLTTRPLRPFGTPLLFKLLCVKPARVNSTLPPLPATAPEDISHV
jgi:hypothetical protein